MFDEDKQILVTEIELGAGNIWKLPVRLEEQDKQFPVDGMFSPVTVSYTHLTLPTICSV